MALVSIEPRAPTLPDADDLLYRSRMPTAADGAIQQLDAFLADVAEREARGLSIAELIPRGLAAIERAAPRSAYAEHANRAAHASHIAKAVTECRAPRALCAPTL
jgi:hypothetical protein